MSARGAETSGIATIDSPEAGGVYDTFEDLQAAFCGLRMPGLHHSEISLLADEKGLKEKFGKAHWRWPAGSSSSDPASRWPRC